MELSTRALAPRNVWRYPTWTTDETVHFSWNVATRSCVHDTSLLVGLEHMFEMLEQLETGIKEFMHKNAFPKEMFRV
jgi:hypothetical protein